MGLGDCVKELRGFYPMGSREPWKGGVQGSHEVPCVI